MTGRLGTFPERLATELVITSHYITAQAAARDLSNEQRAELEQLVLRHGSVLNEVASVAAFAGGLIFTEHRRDELGRLLVDDCGFLAVRKVRVPLIGKLPDWWQPA